MGKFKNITEKKNIHSEIERYLLENGFEYVQYVYGDNYGYQRLFEGVDNGLHCVYVHCYLVDRKLSIYKEYECGGYVDSYECDIPDDLIENDNIDDFVDWLDDECERYL